MSELTYIPYCSITPSMLVCYYRSLEPHSYTRTQTYTGRDIHLHRSALSISAKKKLKLAIETLIYTAKWKTVYRLSDKTHYRFKVALWTLTLPSAQVHSDTDIIKHCLSPFLESISRRNKSFLYTWKAEVQDNGNIHFHVTVNIYLHYKKLQQRWNKYVNALGYVDRSSTSEPNSTDVHSVKNINNLAAYLTSYITKKDTYTKKGKEYVAKASIESRSTAISWELPNDYFKLYIKRKVTSKIWACSRVLLNSKCSVDLTNSDYIEDVHNLEICRDAAIFKDYATIYLLDHDGLECFPQLRNSYLQHINNLIDIQNRVISTYIEKV